jgi:acetolactate synthase-1/3 small subunit
MKEGIMSQPNCERSIDLAAANGRSVAYVRLLVRNHAGVMSHICGLFARRAFNVEGILCLPVGDRTRSSVLLAVNEDERLEQLTRQLQKLEDVIEVRREPRAAAAFAAVSEWTS